MNLIKQENEIVLNGEKIKLPLPIPICIDVAYRTMRGDIIDCDDLANYCKISQQEAIAILLNPHFGAMIHHLAIANAKVGFDATAFNKLIRIANSIDSKDSDKINAIKALGDMLGYNESKKQKAGTQINLNIDTIIRKAEKEVFPGF